MRINDMMYLFVYENDFDIFIKTLTSQYNVRVDSVHNSCNERYEMSECQNYI